MSATLPMTVTDARLPVQYEAAQKALTECSRVDECKDWADRAAALSAYARMAKNDNLRLMALRIQERATRRMGELLKQIEPAQGGDRRSNGGQAPVDSRKASGDAAGLSEHRRKTAIRVANIPTSVFEGAVESDSPPTLSALARLGTVPREQCVADVLPADARTTAAAHTRLRELAAFCSVHNPVCIAMATTDTDAYSAYVRTIDSWLDRFITNLPT